LKAHLFNDSSESKQGSSPSHAIAYAKLIAAAKKMRAKTVEQAHGTCLTMSLEFCIIAQQHNIPVFLVMWPVRHDPSFSDHWAVCINNSDVIDLTRIQIDPKPSADVIFKIESYPHNFSVPRFYLTKPLVDEYLSFKSSHLGKLPPILIKNLRNLMLQQDLSNANHFKNFSGIWSALWSYLKFRVSFGLSQFHDKLQKRHDELTKR